MKIIKRKGLLILALILAVGIVLGTAFLFAPRTVRALDVPYGVCEKVYVNEEINETDTEEGDNGETTNPDEEEKTDGGSTDSDGGKSFNWLSIIIAAGVFVLLVIAIVIIVAINKHSSRKKLSGEFGGDYDNFSDGYAGGYSDEERDYAFERLKADYEKYMYDNYDGDDDYDDDDDFDDDYDDDLDDF